MSFPENYFFSEMISVTTEVNAIRSDEKYWDFGVFGAFGLLLMLPGLYGIKTAITKMKDEQ